MIVSGSVALAAAPGAVRAVLEDPETLSRALPNVDRFGWSDGPAEGSFAVTIRPALALGEIPVRTVWQRLESTGVADAASAEASADGPLRYRVEGRTDEQRVDLDVLLEIAPGDSAAASRVSWQLGVHVTGTLRAAGQRVIAPIVERQVRLVLEAAGEEAAR
ncbi:SRPBCC domain-containing protein [Conexibacter stalactiti]|uniref:SRPBCC domain-containing protein n=1 Tax=Conexibacter stalactiti TaxID=1940611 RepID=A0ABU4HZG9_9ACTN|nr:SRPBCC domain-containing protein [Conexibacter stalactiti]MDW5597890.1 SRPBCC domain-containing protein [Conexibacter stalactiti]MEC5038532.1 SRPBCC domain-containing protein [Conexibacter stalactiti]